MCPVKCWRAHLLPRGKGGHRDHTSLVGFYLFFAETSRDCLGGGKVELRAGKWKVELRAVVAGGMQCDPGCKSLQELGRGSQRDPGQSEMENIPLRSLRNGSVEGEKLPVPSLPTQTSWAGPQTHLATAPGAGHCWLRKPEANVALTLIQPQQL